MGRRVSAPSGALQTGAMTPEARAAEAARALSRAAWHDEAETRTRAAAVDPEAPANVAASCEWIADTDALTARALRCYAAVLEPDDATVERVANALYKRDSATYGDLARAALAALVAPPKGDNDAAD